MLTLTQQCLERQAQAFLDMVTHGQYKLSGTVVERAPIYKKVRAGNTIRIYLMINVPEAGVVSEIKLQAADNTILAQSDEVLQKPEAKGIYSNFKYKFIEQEVLAVE